MDARSLAPVFYGPETAWDKLTSQPRGPRVGNVERAPLRSKCGAGPPFEEADWRDTGWCLPASRRSSRECERGVDRPGCRSRPRSDAHLEGVRELEAVIGRVPCPEASAGSCCRDFGQVDPLPARMRQPKYGAPIVLSARRRRARSRWGGRRPAHSGASQPPALGRHRVGHAARRHRHSARVDGVRSGVRFRAWRRTSEWVSG